MGIFREIIKRLVLAACPPIRRLRERAVAVEALAVRPAINYEDFLGHRPMIFCYGEYGATPENPVVKPNVGLAERIARAYRKTDGLLGD